MPTNGSSSNPAETLAGDETAAPSKKSRAKTAKSRRASTSTSNRSAAPRTAEPSEILFKDQPNPYHPSIPPFIWIDHPQERERLLGPVYVNRLGVGGAESSAGHGADHVCGAAASAGATQHRRRAGP